MKKTSLKHLLAAGALALTTSAYADFAITFDSPTQSTEWSGGDWSAGPAGWADAGCIQATNTGGGWQGSGTVTVNFSYSSGHQPNLWTIDPSAGHVSFDILVNGASFNATDDQWWQIHCSGNSGVAPGWTQSQVVSPPNHSTADTALHIYHVDLTFDQLGWTADDAAGFTYYQLNVWANSDTPNPINFYVDNINVYTATTVTPTNYIAKVTDPRGLTLVTSSNVYIYDVGQEQYQRQNVRTANPVAGWVGSPDPVTYSLTITNYPSVTYSNFQTQIWLVNGIATANAPDYNSAAVVSLAINQNADGTANGHLAYKVNQPNGVAMFYDTGNLGDCFSSTVLGTWSIQFTNDDYVVITSPSGNTWSTNLIAGDGVANFADGITAYIDSQAILVNNIGQQAVFSKFQITSNNVTLFSDDFSSTTIDASKWATAQAEDPANVYQIPTTAAYKLSWTLPDGGFALQGSSDLSTWASPGLPTTTIGGQRTTFLSTTSVSTNSAKFYRLIHP